MLSTYRRVLSLPGALAFSLSGLVGRLPISMVTLGIVVLVSSLHELKRTGVAYVFSDRHAKLETATFFDDDSKLADAVDFNLLQRRDFKRDPERPDKVERYQAEALAYQHVPVAAILGVGCYTSTIKSQLDATCLDLGVKVKVVHRSEWYFS